MLLQTYLLNEIEVGIEDLLWCMVRKYSDQQTHDTLHNQGITLCREMDAPILIVGLEPYTALTPVNQVLLRLIAFVEGSQFVTQID